MKSMTLQPITAPKNIKPTLHCSLSATVSAIAGAAIDGEPDRAGCQLGSIDRLPLPPLTRRLALLAGDDDRRSGTHHGNAAIEGAPIEGEQRNGVVAGRAGGGHRVDRAIAHPAAGGACKVNEHGSSAGAAEVVDHDVVG